MKNLVLIILVLMSFSSCTSESIYEGNANCFTENVSTIVIQNSFPLAANLEYSASNDSSLLAPTSIQIGAGQSANFRSFSNHNYFRLRMIDTTTNSIIYSAKKAIVTEACGLYQMVF